MGTPDYDRDLDSPLARPLRYDNVMYSFHFYAASHYAKMQDTLTRSISQGLPVFISECGVSEADGDGNVDLANAAEWFKLLEDNGISFAVWSLSNKKESSALIRYDSLSEESLEDDDLSYAGLWVRELIKGEDPLSIDVGEDIGWHRTSLSYYWRATLGNRGTRMVGYWPFLAAGSALIILLAFLIGKRSKVKKTMTYDDIPGAARALSGKERRLDIIRHVAIVLGTFFSMVYLFWRICFTLPKDDGVAMAANIILFIVEVLGFAESLIHYLGMIKAREHPLPEIEDSEYPDVDIFIATYNEDTDLLERTVNGCRHLRYPDKEKVHIYICDDNRRPAMKKLAAKMGVNYFDRPDNKGAKAGNLNCALARTSSPYVVTLDADMIVRRDFLMKTMPYFVLAEKYNQDKEDKDKIRLGLLQTPQCFYDPDVFQHALYSENQAPNEQDFFYRHIEPAKTATNSVIYGGSNTVLARQALEDIGGFYTGSITEDFATGALIENAGYVSLGLKEPLASGRTPHTFREHIQQRTRWGRGVIVTARKLKLFRLKGLSLLQKLSYWSSVVYWYSPVKNLIYILSPLLFAVFNIPVFATNWLELAVYWLPMFIMQDITLRLISGNKISTKWSGIYETAVMPGLFIPIVKEALGISLSTFKVTDKSAKDRKRKSDIRSMLPFIILSILSIIGLVRVCYLMFVRGYYGLLTLLMWMIRNLYFLIMSIFLVDGRDSDGEVVKVKDGEPVTVCKDNRKSDAVQMQGITTLLTEHSIDVYLDEPEGLKIGDAVKVVIDNSIYAATLKGVIIAISEAKSGAVGVHRIEILDMGNDYYEYLQILYDRIPTLPQSLHRDFGVLGHIWKNIALRLARSYR